jgi:hypothetical protein
MQWPWSKHQGNNVPITTQIHGVEYKHHLHCSRIQHLIFLSRKCFLPQRQSTAPFHHPKPTSYSLRTVCSLVSSLSLSQWVFADHAIVHFYILSNPRRRILTVPLLWEINAISYPTNNKPFPSRPQSGNCIITLFRRPNFYLKSIWIADWERDVA